MVLGRPCITAMERAERMPRLSRRNSRIFNP